MVSGTVLVAVRLFVEKDSTVDVHHALIVASAALIVDTADRQPPAKLHCGRTPLDERQRPQEPEKQRPQEREKQRSPELEPEKQRPQVREPERQRPQEREPERQGTRVDMVLRHGRL